MRGERKEVQLLFFFSHCWVDEHVLSRRMGKLEYIFGHELDVALCLDPVVVRWKQNKTEKDQPSAGEKTRRKM